MVEKREISPEAKYAAIVEALVNNANVTLGKPGKKGFGSRELTVGGKIFAMLSNDRLVVKLPRQQVEALIQSGDGERFDPQRNGRLMKEWLVVYPSSERDWLALARDALEFVASK